MTDTSKAKWELTKNDLYAIEWFNKNGFDVTLKKHQITKTIYDVSKDGITDSFSLPNGFNYDIAGYMEQYNKSWELLVKIKKNGGIL